MSKGEVHVAQAGLNTLVQMYKSTLLLANYRTRWARVPSQPERAKNSEVIFKVCERSKMLQQILPTLR